MREFKVGDWVQIKDDCPKGALSENFGVRVGNTYKVKDIITDNLCLYLQNNKHWWIDEEYVTLVDGPSYKTEQPGKIEYIPPNKTKLSISQLVQLKQAFSLDEIKELLKEGIL